MSLSTKSESDQAAPSPIDVKDPLVTLGLGLLIVLGLFFESIIELVDLWLTSEKYGHGILFPFVAAYFSW